MRSMLPSSVHSGRRALRAAAARAVLEAVEPRQFLSATVSGTVFNDANKDGARQAGEAGVGGKVVFADYNNNGAVDAGEPSATTGSTGAYSLAGIKSDFSSVGVRLANTAAAQVVKPSGGIYYARYNNGDSRTGYDFALVPPAATTGTAVAEIRDDVDGDGSRNNGEGTLDGVRVYVDANNNGAYDAGEPTTLSGQQGFARITLPAGTYTLRATVAGSAYATYKQTGPYPGPGGYYTIQVKAGESNGYPYYYFSFAPTTAPAPSATLSGTVFNDANKNGTKDSGDAGVANQTVFADYDGDGAIDAGEPSVATQADGTYVLRGVKSDNSSVGLRLLGVAAANVVKPSGGVYYARYNGSVARGGLDFALVPTSTPPTATSIAFRPYFDANGNGALDSGETTGPADATVWLDANGNGLRDGTEPLLTLTSSGGVPTYSLANVAPGTYTVALRLAGDADSYSDYNTSVTVTAGQTATVYRAIPTTSTNRGTVYSDANGNGVRDSGEAGLGGVTVFADYDFDGALDAGEPRTTTAGDGTYALKGIRADNNPFRLSLANLPSGAAVTAPAAGYYQARYDRAYDIGNINFGVKPATTTPTVNVGGFLFNDANGNGVYEPAQGDSGRDFETVYLDLNNDGRYDTSPDIYTRTNGGSFGFSAPGDGRTVQVRLRNQPASRVSTPPGAGYTFKLTAAGAIDLAFGLLPPAGTATTSGTVYNDRDRDTTIDADEGGVGQITVFGDYNGNGVLDAGEPSTTTDSGGNYTLTTTHRVVQVTALLAGTNYVSTTYDGSSRQYVDVFDASKSGINFGIASKPSGTATVTGLVYRDANSNGRLDSGEATRAGARVYSDLNSNGQFDAGEPSVLSGSDGRYSLSFPASGPAVIRVSGLGVGESSYTHYLSVYETSTTTGQDFPIYYSTPTRATIMGSVFDDLNGNGVQDAGEKAGPFQNGYDNQIVVYADMNGDGVLDNWAGGYEPTSSVDSQTGTFGLEAPLGSYTVRLDTRNGPTTQYLQTRPAGNGGYAVSTTSSDPIRSGVTFGVSRVTAPHLSGTVFVDDDGDGVRDAGEPGYNDYIDIFAEYYGEGGSVGNSDVVHANPDGTFNLIVRPNLSFKLVARRGNGARTESVTTYDFAGGLARGDNRSGLDFAYPQTTEVALKPYLDTNGNGRFDPYVDVAPNLYVIWDDGNGNGVIDGREDYNRGYVAYAPAGDVGSWTLSLPSGTRRIAYRFSNSLTDTSGGAADGFFYVSVGTTPQTTYANVNV